MVDRRGGGPLGIAVHDHIIVGKDGHASLKALKLIWIKYERIITLVP